VGVGRLDRHPLAARGVVGEQVAQVDIPQLGVMALERPPLLRAGDHLGSMWPPNCLRIADSSLSVKSASPRELKRSYSAAVRTWAGMPSSTAAITVHRPSPLSDTRPLKSERSGSSCSAMAMRSSSHDEITLPRRH